MQGGRAGNSAVVAIGQGCAKDSRYSTTHAHRKRRAHALTHTHARAHQRGLHALLAATRVNRLHCMCSLARWTHTPHTPRFCHVFESSWKLPVPCRLRRKTWTWNPLTRYSMWARAVVDHIRWQNRHLSRRIGSLVASSTRRPRRRPRVLRWWMLCATVCDWPFPLGASTRRTAGSCGP